MLSKALKTPRTSWFKATIAKNPAVVTFCRYNEHGCGARPARPSDQQDPSLPSSHLFKQENSVHLLAHGYRSGYPWVSPGDHTLHLSRVSHRPEKSHAQQASFIVWAGASLALTGIKHTLHADLQVCMQHFQVRWGSVSNTEVLMSLIVNNIGLDLASWRFLCTLH